MKSVRKYVGEMFSMGVDLAKSAGSAALRTIDTTTPCNSLVHDWVNEWKQSTLRQLEAAERTGDRAAKTELTAVLQCIDLFAPTNAGEFDASQDTLFSRPSERVIATIVDKRIVQFRRPKDQ